jgi:dihydroorotate dehydrogenase
VVGRDRSEPDWQLARRRFPARHDYEHEQKPMKNGYERFIRPLLFSLDAETAHDLTIALLRSASRVDPALRALSFFQPVPKPKTVFGVNFPNPIGLAAGLDKNGVALTAWAAMGFGFVEIGTVTAKAQPGNPKPRIFRFPEQRALINRLGFNNDGAGTIASRLQKLRESGRWPANCRVGINIGKSRVTPLTEATGDYLYSFRLLRDFADYIALNVSSPNTPGLRELQDPAALSQLLRAIRDENQISGKPILVKIAPDLSSTELEEIIGTCEENEVAGLIATNTTLDHSSIPPARDQAGGLSGAPLREKSTALVRSIFAKSKIPVIASGGICDGESAREKFEAGAQLLQIYTGYIYRGTRLLREIVETIS